MKNREVRREKTAPRSKTTWIIATIALLVASTPGCDASCDEEGKRECQGADLRECKNGKWDYISCLEDECEPLGYSSATCTENPDGTAQCECGVD